MDEILQFLKMIKNPKEYVMNNYNQNNNPMLNNLINMANKNDIDGLENFARNFLGEKGQNYDEIKKFLK